MICEAVGIEFNKNLWDLRKEFRIEAIESSAGIEIERIFWDKLMNCYWGRAAGVRALVPQDDIILVIPKPLFSIYSDLRIHKNWDEFEIYIPFSTTRI